MKALSIEKIAEAVGATDVFGPATPEVTSVVFDSRLAQPGSLFVPLQGQLDGHQFAKAAQEKGAIATFWMRDKAEIPEGLSAIIVSDTLKALQDLAKAYLALIQPKVVAITGSAGKTTTKDMTAAALSAGFSVHKTGGNYNNEIGLPIMVLSMPEETEVLVLEMGMSEPGEIELLSRLAEPDIAVITMIGESHLANFGSREKIAAAKLEILTGLKAQGTFIYPGNEPLLSQAVAQADFNCISVGLEETDNIYAFDCESDQYSASFNTNLSPATRLSIPVTGPYNISNALNACAVAYSLGLSVEQIAEPLSHFEMTSNRLAWVTGPHGSMILDDTYNANPQAMTAVLRHFTSLPRAGEDHEGRKLYVLGDMLELGEASWDRHAALSNDIDLAPEDQILLFGEEMAALDQALAADSKIQPGQVHYFKTRERLALKQWLLANIDTTDQVLVKGSHGMNLLDLVHALAEAGQEDTETDTTE